LSRLAVSVRRLRTAFRLIFFGRAEVMSRRHEPLPDLLRPGMCSIEGLELDDPLHQRRRRKARRPGTDLVAERGWR
jgi:hypothetical protein